ncbi:MAG: MarR family transcriptional regulator [Pirellulales bacterium]|nr:MarR family transcriptional regulator [Pirellulales bacterium]
MNRPVRLSPRKSKIPSDFDSLWQEAYLSLWRTYDRLRAIEDELFDGHDLTAQQYNALRLLERKHPEPMVTSAIAQRLISRAPDITRLIDRLEQRGLVLRHRPAENRRIVQVSISQAGLDLLATLARQVRECHAKQLGHLSSEQLRKLIDLLRQVRLPHEESTSHWR